MSGFAGVFHLDGAPVDRAWVEKMAAFLAFRGPDRSQVWINDNAGLCHTLLRTRAEHDNHPQIASPDGKVWITGDIRIDDRETLFAKLPASSEILRSAGSTELVLHAYAKWGEACVEHLLGDFSFVIWDAERKRVFGARDQLGVFPLFYAQVGQCLLVSNTLDCIRQIPIVPDELNEYAIGDLLIAGANLNPAATFFEAIHRLRPAHRLIVRAEELRTERYWTLEVDEPVYHRNACDYIDRFNNLVNEAVRDRLPDGPLGVMMSGGLDSPAVAAVAVQLGTTTSAFTSVYDHLIPDEERYYAGLVANHLGIPIHYNVRDHEPWGWEPDAAPIHTAEPSHDPLSLVAAREYHREISKHARVFFYGDGPDAALQYEWRSHFAYLISKRRWGRMGQDLGLHFKAFKRVPLLLTLPRMWKEQISNHSGSYEEAIPSWLNPEFETRLHLRERWRESKSEVFASHPTRPKSYSTFMGHFPMCGGGNDGYSPAPIENLHPLGDLRLVRFLLAVPTVPWSRDKYLIRLALKGILPEVVRLRPKSALTGFPFFERAQHSSWAQLPRVPLLERYVDLNKIPAWPINDRDELDYSLRVVGLHYWFLGL